MSRFRSGVLAHCARAQKGFTFIELMVVLIILAILASVGAPIYMEQVKSARAADAQTTIGALKTAAGMYRQKFGKLPRDVQELEQKGFIEIDQATQRNWKFEFTKNRDKLQLVRAISTENMPGGAGNTVEYNAETGKWSGYGQPEE